MKDGWEVRPLGEVAQLLNGRAYKKSELLEEGPHKVLRVGNLFTSQKWYYSDLELPPSKTIDTGDLLYAWSASFGPFRWKGGPAIYHYHIWKVLPDEQQVTRDFLHYYFEWDKERIQEEQGAGATMLHVSKKSMEARAAPLPPLEEQRRIVAVLDEAFEGLARARANIEANLADAEEVFRRQTDALLTEADESWTVSTVGEMCVGFEYGTSSKSKKSGEVSVIRMGNIQGGQVLLDDLVYSDSEEDNRRYALRRGDVLFNRTNSAEHVGKVGTYQHDRAAIFAGYLIRVHPDRDRLTGEFLADYLNSSSARAYGATVMSRSVNQANISATKLKGYPISVPPLEVQRQISDQVRKLERAAKDARSAYTAQLADLDALRNSLLGRAFRGELT